MRYSTQQLLVLVTASARKIFQTDWTWMDPESQRFSRAGDRGVFASEFMSLMARLITLPIPSVCAVLGTLLKPVLWRLCVMMFGL